MQRTTLTIDGHIHQLAQGADLAALKVSIEEAVASGGKFVEVTIVGNVAVSILATPGFPIYFTSQEVDADSRDTGNLDDPFDIFALEIDGHI